MTCNSVDIFFQDTPLKKEDPPGKINGGCIRFSEEIIRHKKKLVFTSR
jgi:hypothetical protein